MALTNFINYFSILGGSFSGAQGLRVLGSSCELVFCQHVRILGFNFNLWAHCRHVKMALTNFINFFSILGGSFSGPQGLRVLGSSCELVICQHVRILGFNSCKYHVHSTVHPFMLSCCDLSFVLQPFNCTLY